MDETEEIEGQQMLLDPVESQARHLGARGASKGGAARARKLSPTTRSEIARRAAETRWGTAVAVATHAGQLQIDDRIIECAVLEDGTRLINQQTLLTSLGRSHKAKGGDAGPVLFAGNLMPFVSDELRTALQNPIQYSTGSTGRVGRSNGYPAELLPAVCEVYLEARNEGVLLPSQKNAARAAEILVRGLARVGIVALVDEATGYQETRAKYELQKILEQYVQAELRPWTKMFPDEFFREIYRLNGWDYKPGSAKRPSVVGHMINKYIYKQLPPGVLEELQRLNPVGDNGRRAHKHHQHVTEGTGNSALDRQIATVTTLLRISDTKNQFTDLFERAYPPLQPRLPLIIEAADDED